MDRILGDGVEVTIREMAVRLFRTGRMSHGPVRQLMVSEGEVHHYLCQTVGPGEFGPSGLELAKREAAQCCLPSIDQFPPAALRHFPKDQVRAAEREVRTWKLVLAAPTPTDLDTALEVLHAASWPYHLKTVSSSSRTGADVLPATSEQKSAWEAKVRAAKRILDSEHAALVERCGGPGVGAVLKVTEKRLGELRLEGPQGLARALLGAHHQSERGILHLPGHVANVWEKGGVFNLRGMGVWARLDVPGATEVLHTLISDRPDGGRNLAPEEFREYAQHAAALVR